MVYKVLVVDDSHFFQERLKEIINEHRELRVVGVAANGHEAIEMADSLKPDVISMDYEMPFLDGVSAVRAILAKRSVPIVMFSSMTYEGAKITLDALAAGAVDFIPKNFAEVSKNSVGLKRKLHDTLLTFAREASGYKPAPTPVQAPSPQQSFTTNSGVSNASTGAATTAGTAAPSSTPSAPPIREARDTFKRAENITARSSAASAQQETKPPEIAPRGARLNLRNKIKIIIIGSSTGGPVALTEILQNIPANFHLPIVVIQHMPENFTKALADRLNKQCHVRVQEASDGDMLERGKVLIAPGGKQLLFDKRGCVKILPGDERMNYKPSVDITFASASNVYRNNVLGVVLTGMGADGCEGARLLKEAGSYIWGQDRASCVVYGMPKAVADARLTDDVIPLKELGKRLVEDV